MVQKIKRWWRWEGKYLPRNIKQGLKNLQYWLPVIWKDRDWDHHFIFEVLKHKLKAQAKYIGKRGIHTEAKKDSRNMKICVSLIQKIQDEYYEGEYLDYSESRFWFESHEDFPGYFALEREDVSENYDEFFKKYPRIYKRVLNGEGMFSREGREEDKSIIAMNIAKINQDRAHKLLFKIMEENILRWWD